MYLLYDDFVWVSSFVPLFCRLGVRWDCFFLSMFVVQFYCWVLLIHLCILLFGKCWFGLLLCRFLSELSDFSISVFYERCKNLFFVDFEFYRAFQCYQLITAGYLSVFALTVYLVINQWGWSNIIDFYLFLPTSKRRSTLGSTSGL